VEHLGITSNHVRISKCPRNLPLVRKQEDQGGMGKGLQKLIKFTKVKVQLTKVKDKVRELKWLAREEVKV